MESYKKELKILLELNDGESEVQFHTVPDDFDLTEFGIDVEELVKEEIDKRS